MALYYAWDCKFAMQKEMLSTTRERLKGSVDPKLNKKKGQQCNKGEGGVGILRKWKNESKMVLV